MNLNNVLSGNDLERAFFGVCAEDVKSLVKPRKLPHQQSIEEVKRIQGIFGWDPRTPRTVPAQTLFEAVRKCLGDVGRVLSLYCGVGTSLEQHHADGFFDIHTGKVVKFDLTIKFHPRSHLPVIDIRKVDLEDDNLPIAQTIARRLLAKKG